MSQETSRRPEIFFLLCMSYCPVQVSRFPWWKRWITSSVLSPSCHQTHVCHRVWGVCHNYAVIWLNWRVLFLVDECRGAGADLTTASLSLLGSTWSSLLAESSIWWFLMCPRRWRWRSRENTTWPKKHWLRTRYKTNFPIKQLCICHCLVWCYPTLMKHQLKFNLLHFTAEICKIWSSF